MRDSSSHVRLGDIVSFEYGSSLPTEVRTGNSYRVFGSSGVVGYHYRPAIDGPAVVVGRKGTVGSVLWSSEPCWPIDTTYWVKPCKEVDTRWLYWVLQTLGLNGMDSSTGVPGLSRNDAYRAVLYFPPIPEQRRIAEILNAADEQIEVGQRELEKCVQIKSATFADLMEFRVGEWPEMAIAHVTSKAHGSSIIGPFGSNLIANDYRPSGVPVVFVRDIKVSGFDWTSGVFVTQEKARELRAHSVQSGDLVVTKMGLPPCVAAEYPSCMESGIITADVIRMRPDVDVTTAKWLMLAINHHAFEAQVRGITSGVTRPKVTLADFRRLKVRIPSLMEQQEIVDLLGLASEKIEIQRERLVKLYTLKQALMHDLLAGHVQVPVGAEM